MAVDQDIGIEIMIGLYEHELETGMIMALAALILVTGILRTLAVVFSPEKYQEADGTTHVQQRP